MGFILCIANFGGPFTYNLLAEITLIINLRRIVNLSLIRILLISFFSAGYRLILYARTQQGVPSGLYFSLSAPSLRELFILFGHLWPLLLIFMNLPFRSALFTSKLSFTSVWTGDAAARCPAPNSASPVRSRESLLFVEPHWRSLLML